MKIKICVFEGGGNGGREENRPKMLFSVRNAMRIQFGNCKFYCREVLLSLRRLLFGVGFRWVGGGVGFPVKTDGKGQN